MSFRLKRSDLVGQMLTGDESACLAEATGVGATLVES